MGGRQIRVSRPHIEKLLNQYEFRLGGLVFVDNLELLPQFERCCLLGHNEIDIFSQIYTDSGPCVTILRVMQGRRSRAWGARERETKRRS